MKMPVSVHLYYGLMEKFCGYHFSPFLLLLCVCVFEVIDLKRVLAKIIKIYSFPCSPN